MTMPYHVIQGVAVTWPYVYLADSGYGLHVLDVSNPAAPQEVGTFTTAGDANGVTAAGDLVYVADGEGGLVILRRQQRVYLPIGTAQLERVMNYPKKPIRGGNVSKTATYWHDEIENSNGFG